jgi:hypothetical protein
MIPKSVKRASKKIMLKGAEGAMTIHPNLISL